jgi:mono/diheme cytochrome c family protein
VPSPLKPGKIDQDLEFGWLLCLAGRLLTSQCLRPTKIGHPMRLKNTIIAIVVLLTSGATVSFAQESHIGNMLGSAAAGKALYRRYCIGCHGPQGDGAGENAAWVDPKPRDFTAATFKCRSTPSGTLPTDQDLYDAITRGFVNTGMPSWKPLTNQNRADLVAYVKGFSSKWKGATAGASIAIPTEPEVKIEGLLHGRELFQKMECWKCHGPEGHGNGPAAGTLTDSKDNPIRPYNFAMGSRFKCGVTNEDLYRIFMTGLDGTPMPSFSDVLKPADAWDLVHFLRTLQPMQTKEAQVWKTWRAANTTVAQQVKPIGPEEAPVQGAMNAQ